jgi:hypothetical protein
MYGERLGVELYRNASKKKAREQQLEEIIIFT